MKSIRNRVIQLMVWACAAVALCFCGAAPALAQATGFESSEGYTGAPEGVSLAGQLGWYTPSVAGSTSTDFFVYTYGGTKLFLPPNFIGAKQFAGAMGYGTFETVTYFPRAQADFDWSASSFWLISYDLAPRFNGALPATNNLSSFSLQDSTVAKSFIALNRWEDLATATHWRADYNVFNAAGMAMDFTSPGTAWRNLLADNWYRQYALIDFASNRVWWVAIFDLYTGDFAEFYPENWYLAGGDGSTRPIPTGLRIFVGGQQSGTASGLGNVCGFDNLEFTPFGGPAPGTPSRIPFARRTRIPPALIADQ
jgi:hypothetical protein